MALHVHRSNRMETLADALAARLDGGLPKGGLARAFAVVPVVVGSRGMASWLGHQMASRRGVLARVDFPFPRQALDGGLAAALGQTSGPRWWQRSGTQDPWQPDALAWRCLRSLRARQDGSMHPNFAPAIAYLRGAGEPWPEGPVTARELTFARDVADVLDRVGSKRPDVALRWLKGDLALLSPDERSTDGWLAELMAEAAQSIPAAPTARSLERLRTAAAAGKLKPLSPHLHVFGLSTQGGTDLEMLALLGTCTEVHLYVLAPSQAWLGESHRGTREQAAGCPLLAGLGGPSRDLQLLLEELPGGYLDNEASSVFASRPGSGALETLQRGLLDDLPLPAADERTWLAEDDNSISLHACPGALRQVEELRDELLRLFGDEEAGIEPRDVVVMTPDIQTYAPLISAAFAPRPDGVIQLHDGAMGVGPLPAIPVHIADLGLRAVNPVAEVMLRVLELAGERLTLAVLLDLLALGPIQTRFELDDEDVTSLQRMLIEAGARWGLDAADREAAGQPRLHQNTIGFAMERIALGALFGDHDGAVLTATGVADDEARDGSLDFVPYAATDGAGRSRFGKLHSLLEALRQHRDAVSSEAKGGVWRSRLEALRADLCATSDEAAWLEARVDDELGAFFDGLRAAGFEGEIRLDALRTWLQGRFDVPRSGQRTITGAVTVCALEPMRSVPFKVVALLGMDDACFPRAARVRAWDPMGRDRRLGEHDRRAADRHLLLEALISARRRLMVTWTASDERSGEPLPPAVPVAELMEVLDGRLQVDQPAHGPALRARDALTTRVPLQPWSSACFDGGRARSFNSAMLTAAQRVRDLGQGAQAPQAATICYGEPGARPERNAAPGVVSFDALSRDVLRPARLLLKSRHEVRLGEDVELVPEREVLGLDSLDDWKIRDQVMRGVLGGESQQELVEQTTRSWRAEGRLPVGALGPQLVADLGQEGADIAAEALALVLDAGQTVAPLRAQSRVVGADGWTVDVSGTYGQLTPISDQESKQVAVDATASKHRDERLLRPWIALLTATIEAATNSDAQAPVAVASLARSTSKRKAAKTTWLQPPACPARAAAQLRAIVTTWRRAHHQPVPLFEEASLALVQALARQDCGLSWWRASESTRKAARRAFHTKLPKGDPCIETVWGEIDLDERLPLTPTGLSPEPPWVTEAVALFAPMLTAMVDGPPPPEPIADQDQGEAP